MAVKVSPLFILGCNFIILITSEDHQSPFEAQKITSPYEWSRDPSEQLSSQPLEKFSSASTSSNNNLDFDPLPPEKFALEVYDLLAPEIFTQSDLMLYLLEKTVKLPPRKISFLEFDMKFYLAAKNKFPACYVPYAVALWRLLRCQRDLKDLKLTIENIQLSSKALGYLTLPSGLLSLKLSELFSSDIFSDENPPFQIMVKLMNVAKDDIEELRIQLYSLSRNDQLPKEYLKYTQQLYLIFLYDAALKNLIKSVAQMRNMKARNATQI